MKTNKKQAQKKLLSRIWWLKEACKSEKLCERLGIKRKVPALVLRKIKKKGLTQKDPMIREYKLKKENLRITDLSNLAE